MDSNNIHLPEGWVRSFDEKKRRAYYINTSSSHTQWEWPTYVASDLPPPADDSFSHINSHTGARDHAVVEDDWLLMEKTDAGDGEEKGKGVLREGEEQPLFERIATVTSETTDSIAVSVSGHLEPQNQRKAGNVRMFFLEKGELPGNKVKKVMEVWCVVEASEMFLLPTFDSLAKDVLYRLPLVDVSEINPITELQSGGLPFALELNVSESNSKTPRGGKQPVFLVMGLTSEEEREEWSALLSRVSRAMRNWRVAAKAPEFIGEGLKSAGKIAFGAFGAGFGWTLGRDAGASTSRAVGLR